MSMVQSGRFEPEKLITHKFYGFGGIEEAFNLMAGRPQDIIKPIIYIDK